MAEKRVSLVDADELLTEFLRRYTKHETDKNFMFTACEIKQDFADMMCEFPTIDPKSLQPQWHDAETDPPKEPMEYIVMIKGGANATTLLYDGRLWFEEDEEGWQTYYKVTHWMPLPNPPEKQ